MSTSDQDGNARLTRKQLREIRLTGSTPVITEEDAAAPVAPEPVAPAAPSEPAQPEPAQQAPVKEVVETHTGEVPMTRRQARAQERLRTGPVPHVTEEAPAAEAAPEAAVQTEPTTIPAAVEPVAEAPAAVDTGPQLVSAVPDFAPAAPKDVAAPVTDEHDSVAAIFAGRPAAAPEQQPAPAASEPVVAEKPAPVVEDKPETPQQERPMVGAAFGIGVKPTAKDHHVPAFDDLIDGDSSGRHTGSSALIFTPSPGMGSLSGPVASTGELLITGTYSLPDGIGSQGHAHGVADGKDVDAVLIDGELAPASSPTPIAASSAVSTLKPAGEVIRPPAPDKGNKLMLTLAIVAGGLALALAAALIIAFTTRVFG